MSENSYASPQIAETIKQTFGKETSSIKINMRSSRDVSTFINKVEAGFKKTAKNSLSFSK